MISYKNFCIKIGIFLVLIYFVNLANLTDLDKPKPSKKHGCVRLLSNLSLADQEFTRCALLNSVPVTICSTCKGSYDNFVESYTTLYHAFDIELNQSCKELYFNQDRLNAVEYIFHSVNNLWEKGFCSECYDGDSIGNDTEQLLSRIEVVNLCINETGKHACKKCLGKYQMSNSLYEEFITNHKNKVCFDIQDAMNRTRYLWSHVLGCCKRTSDLTAFIAVSSILCFLPFFFYGGFVLHTRRSERNHTANTILNNAPEEERSATNSTTSPSSPNISPTVAENTSSTEQLDFKKSQVLGNGFSAEDDDDGDDELLE